MLQNSVIKNHTDEIFQKEMTCLEKHPVPVIWVINPNEGLYILLVNAQSFHLSFQDVITDYWFRELDVLVFYETRFKEHKNYEVSGLSEITWKDKAPHGTLRSHCGLDYIQKWK